jgi:hypothetical protein
MVEDVRFGKFLRNFVDRSQSQWIKFWRVLILIALSGYTILSKGERNAGRIRLEKPEPEKDKFNSFVEFSKSSPSRACSQYKVLSKLKNEFF